MGSWANLYNPPPGVPLGFTLGDINRRQGNAQIDAANTSFDQGQGFDRATADTVTHMSAMGAGRSSAKDLATNRIFEDYSRDQGRNQLSLARASQDLQRQRALATFGVIY